MSLGSGDGTLTEINVTPLVDVMLVLLIVFMVAAPMLQTGIEVELPQAKAQTIDDQAGKLILTLNKERRLFLGKMEIDFNRAAEVLKNNAKLRRQRGLPPRGQSPSLRRGHQSDGCREASWRRERGLGDRRSRVRLSIEQRGQHGRPSSRAGAIRPRGFSPVGVRSTADARAGARSKPGIWGIGWLGGNPWLARGHRGSRLVGRLGIHAARQHQGPVGNQTGAFGQTERPTGASQQKASAPPPPTSPSPASAALKVATDPKASTKPPKKTQKRKPQKKSSDPAAALADAMAKARRLGAAESSGDERYEDFDTDAEGDPEGLRDGTATEAREGDRMATLLHNVLHRRWRPPQGLISADVLRTLKCDIRIRFLAGGKVTGSLTKSSGNDLFDDSALNAVKAIGTLPAKLRGMGRKFPRGVTIEFDGSDL